MNIIKTFKRNNGNSMKVNWETYNTAQEMVDDLEKRGYSSNRYKEDQKDNEDRMKKDSDWFGGVRTNEEAFELLRNGYSINVEEFNKDLKSKAEGIGKRFTFRNNVCGFAPVVPLSILNVPECMLDITTKPIKAKVLTIIYSNSCNAGTSNKTIIDAGKKFLSAITQLEMEGYRFNLYATQNYTDNNSSDIVTIKVKSANQPLDIKRCAFPLMHTAFFRVIGFEWVARTPNGKYRHGYGRELRSELNSSEFTRFVEEIYGKDNIYISIEQIRDKKLEHIKEMLKYDKRNKT